MAILELHFEILDRSRQKILPLLAKFKDRFYLAGGTALALQLGHRDSIDFDFFTQRKFDSNELLREVKEVFADYKVEVVQAGNMTLNLIIDDQIRVSFFCIKDRLLEPLIETPYLNLATLTDIACMKMTALLRAELKDYIDLYYLFKEMPLGQVLDNCVNKYDEFNVMVYLKALASFDDIKETKILFVKGKTIFLSVIKKDFNRRIREYLKEKRQ